MNSLTAQFVLFAWIPIAIGLFACLPPRRAVLTAIVVGWLFLPVAMIRFPGLPDFGKMEATSLTALLGVLLFDARSLLRFRPTWLELPLACWCLSPIPTSISNDLGLYDGISGMLVNLVQWGVPVILGRIYLRDLESFRDAALAMVFGGLAYLPFCWAEIMLSPQLHHWIYGYFPMDFVDIIRNGGYKPVVFLGSGVAVPTFMATATAVAYAVWRSGERFKFPSSRLLPGIVVALAVTTYFCKSLNGMLEMSSGIAAIEMGRRFGGRWLLVGMALLPVVYMTARATGVMPAEVLANVVRSFDDQRAKSLEARLEQEDLFTDHTWQQPTFGWGGWLRNFPTDEQGKKLTRGVDGFWTVAISKYGLFGLASATLVLTIGLLSLAWQVPSPEWTRPQMAFVFAIAVIVGASVIDNLFNGQLNPLFFLYSGGLLTFALNWSVSADDARKTSGVVLRQLASPAIPVRRLVVGGPR